jgi:hypothetical protein
MLRVGKIIGEKALSLLKIQMNGEINLIQPRHPIVGEIPHLVQGNPNPICGGTEVNGRKAHRIGEISPT